MTKYNVEVSAVAYCKRYVIVEAENADDASFAVEKLFAKDDFYELGFNWILPEKIQENEVYDVTEIK